MTKVLIVDDAKLMHKLLTGILSQREVEITSAYDGNEAIEAVKKAKPDIIFLDVVMPNKDGMETLKELKLIYPDIKVLMASSMGTKEKIIDALRIGAIGFLQKPYDEDVLLSKFDEIIMKG
ncbi:MAG: response regulator [Campylobacterota bacterium]|nr:response regulator [Campylobacterota bacterium]